MSTHSTRGTHRIVWEPGGVRGVVAVVWVVRQGVAERFVPDLGRREGHIGLVVTLELLGVRQRHHTSGIGQNGRALAEVRWQRRWHAVEAIIICSGCKHMTISKCLNSFVFLASYVGGIYLSLTKPGGGGGSGLPSRVTNGAAVHGGTMGGHRHM